LTSVVPKAVQVGAEANEEPSDRGRVLRKVVGSTLLWAVVLSVIAWPYSVAGLSPNVGLDPSWQGTLAMAAQHHLHFGTQIVFTYGPLGFLANPALYFPFTGILAFFYELAVSVSVFFLLIHLIRGRLALPWAVLSAYIVGAVVLLTQIGPEISLPIALAVSLELLGWPRRAKFPTKWWIALGVVLGVFPLIKVSLGLGLAVIVIATVVCVPNGRARAALTVFVTSAAIFTVGWFGTGNGLGNIAPFVQHAIPIATGYSAAMANSIQDSGNGYVKLLALVSMVLLIGITIWFCRGESRRIQIGVITIVAVTTWLLAKESFVRFDAQHSYIFFAALPIMVVALLAPKLNWPGLVIGMAIAVIMCVLAAGSIPSLALRPDTSARHFEQETQALASARKRAAIIKSAHSYMRAVYAIPPAMLRLMNGKTVDVAPWEQNVAWAYPALRFDPLPVPQDYSAYTASLDELDVRDLESSAAPEFILQQVRSLSVDGRLASMDPPTTQLEKECWYREVKASASWQLLKRGTNRCGRVQLVESVSTRSSQSIRVPTVDSHDDLVASFSLSVPISWALENVVLKPPLVCLSATSAGSKGPQSYRFVTGTAGDLHVVSAATTVDYSPPFVPTKLRTISLAECHPGTSFGVTVHFYKIPVRASHGQ
jgi:hypothetical protein